MDFFPHRIPPTIVGSAVSASAATSASFINNFAATAIDTAQLALNFVGSPGTAGTSFTKTGRSGATGEQGDRGYRGKNVYLLASGWGTGSKSVSYQTDGLATTTYNGSQYICDYGQSPNFYYTNGDTVLGIQAGYILYYDSACTIPVPNALLTDPLSGVYSTNGSGVLTYVAAGCIGI